MVLSSLADDAAVEDVYLGPEGIVQGIGPGSVAVDASTIDPRTVERVGAAVDATGAGFLDCPVSGSVSTVVNQPRPDNPARAVRIEDEVWARVKAVAKRRGTTASEVVRTALVEHLKRDVGA